MKDSKLINEEIQRIKEIMMISEATLPPRLFISALEDVLPTFLTKTGAGEGRVALDALTDVEKTALRNSYKIIDATIDDATLNSKTGSELVEFLVNNSSKLGKNGIQSLMSVTKNIDALADDVAQKIVSNSEVISSLEKLGKKMTGNPKLYDRTFKEIEQEVGTEIAQKIFKLAKVNPPASTITKLELTTIKAIEDALRADTKTFKAYKSVFDNSVVMEELYKKADELVQSGQQLTTKALFDIIDEYAPEAQKNTLKQSFSDIFQKLYTNKFGEVSVKTTTAKLYSIWLGFALLAGVLKYSGITGRDQRRKWRTECFLKPRIITYAGKEYRRQYTMDEITSGTTGNGTLPTEEQLLFNQVIQQCKTEVDNKTSEEAWVGTLNKLTFGMWSYFFSKASNKIEGVKSDESSYVSDDDIIQIGTGGSGGEIKNDLPSFKKHFESKYPNKSVNGSFSGPKNQNAEDDPKGTWWVFTNKVDNAEYWAEFKNGDFVAWDQNTYK
jgi:hypothetical protein